MLSKRFFGKALLWCMLLCVCLFGGAAAEETTEEEIVLRSVYFEDVIYVGGNSSPNVFDVYFDNYEDFDDYGAADWSYTVDGASSDLFYLDEGNNYVYFYLDKQPETVGDLTVTVTCSYGGMQSSIDVVVPVVDLGVSAGEPALQLESITFTAGETYTLPLQVLLPKVMTTYTDYHLAMGMNKYVSILSQGYDLIFSCYTPGVYTIRMSVDHSNFYSNDEKLFVFVTDENGNYPEPAPEINPTNIEHTIFVNGNSGHSWGIDISNYDSVKYWFDSDPVWTLTSLTGESDVIYLAESDRTNFVWLECPGDANLVGDATYQLDCTWGDMVVSIPITIHVIDFTPTAPTGLDLPSEITVQAGNTFTLPVRPGTLPEQVEIPDGMYSFSYLDSFYGNPYYEESEGDEYHTYIAVTPGIYETNFYYTLGNHRFTHAITIRIADENGVVPEPAIQLSTDSLPDALYVGGNLYSTFTTVHFDNYYSLPYSGEVNWDISVSGASEDLIWTSWGNSYYNIYLDEQPETAGDITFTVSCSYGELYEEIEFTIPVIDLGDDMPTEPNLPESISFTSGEIVTLPKSDLLPEVFAGLKNCSMWFSWNEHIRIQDNGDYFSISCTTPGTYPIEFTLEAGNVRLESSCLVSVADQDGNVPPLAFDLISYDNVTEVDLFVNGNCLSNLDYYYIDYFDLLSKYISGTPEWSIEVVNGDFRPFELDLNDRGAYLNLVQHPTTPGTMTLRVNCTWGGHTETKEMIVNVHGADESIPTGLNIPDEITAKVDEDIIIDVTQVVAPSELTADYFGFDPLSSMSWSYSNYGDTYRITVHEPGIYMGEYSWRCGNLELTKQVKLKIADSEGNVPELGIDLSANATERILDVNGNFYDTLNYMEIENEYLLETLYGGEPTWSMEVVSGSADLIDLDVYKISANLRAIGDFAAVGDTTVRVTVTWGDLSESILFTLHVVDSGLTDSGLILPEEIVVTTGELFTLDAWQMMPDSWSDLGEAPSIYVSSSPSGAFTTHSYSDKTPVLKALTPGTYVMNVHWNWLNVYISDSVLLKIADENGHIPSVELGMRYRDYAEADTFYLGGKQGIELGYYQITNYDLLQTLYGGAPQWHVSAGEYTDCFDVYGDIESRYVDFGGIPTEECDITYTVTCTWGDLTYADTQTIHFVDAGELTPAGLDVPGTIRMKAGEKVAIPAPEDVALLPAGALYSPGEPHVSFYGSSMIEEMWEGNTPYITCDTPGTYYIRYTWSHYNFYLSGMVVVEVEDENGNVPMPDPGLYVYDRDALYAGGNETYLTDYDFNNSALYYSLYGGQPTVVATCADPSIVLRVEPYLGEEPDYPYGSIEFVETPTVPGEYEVTVTCTWGESVTSETFTFTVLENPYGIPTGLNLPDEMTLALGEKLAIEHATLVQPDGWYLDEAWYDVWFHSNRNDDPLSWYDEYDGFTWFIAETPGIHHLTLELHVANFHLSKDVRVTILDENGEVPSTDLSIEPRYVVYDNTRDVFLSGNSDTLYGFRIPGDVYRSMRELNGGMPTWSISNVEGNLHLAIEESNEGEYLDVKRIGEITSLGATSGEVTCTWGDQSVTLPFTINVVPDPEVVPEYLDVPDTMTIMVGENFTVRRDMIHPVGVELSPNLTSFGVGASGDTWDYLQHVNGNDDETVYRFTTPGVYRLNYHWEYVNFFLTKDVIVTVTDENGNVPMPELKLYSGFPQERTIYLNGNRDYIQHVVIDWDIYQQLSALMPGTEPSWSITVLEGDLRFNLDSFGDTTNVFYTQQPTSLGKTVARVDCTWGNLSASFTFALNVVEGLEIVPTSVDFPSRLDLTVGDTFTIPRTSDVILPAGSIPADAAEMPDVGISANYDIWQYMEWADSDYQSVTYRVTSPGVYPVFVHFNFANFQGHTPCMLYVADENGDVPATGLQIDTRFNVYDNTRDVFFSGNNSTMYGFYIPDGVFETMRELNGGSPTWSMSNLEGDLHLAIESFNDGQYLDVKLAGEITSLGATSGEITCTWGDLSTTMPFTVNVVPDPEVVPEYMDVPDTMTLMVGEHFSIRRDMIRPVGVELSPALTSFGLGANGDVWEHIQHVYSNEDEHVNMFTTPGIYVLYYTWDYVNFTISKEVIVTVTDEDGNVPMPELELHASFPQERTIYLNGNSDRAQYIFINWDTYQLLSAMMPGIEPSWSITVLEGDLDLVLESNIDAINVFYTQLPTSLGRTVARVDCTWGDLSASFTFALNVVEGLEIVPTSVDFPSRLDLTVGDTFTVPRTSDAILPAGSIPADAAEMPDVGLSARENVWDTLEIENMNDQFVTYRVTRPGVYPISVYFNFANFAGNTSCMLYVADENGVVPEPDLQLELWPMTGDLTRTLYTYGDSWNLYNYNIDWELANQLVEIYGEWPSWSYEVLEGSLPIQMNAESTFADFYYDGELTEEQQVVVRVDCTCGDLTASSTFTLNIVDLPIDPPTGLNFPDTLTLQVGETFTVYTDCVLPEGWTLEGEMPRVFVNGNSDSAWEHLIFASGTADSITYFFDQPGTYPVNVEWNIANISVYKSCIIRVLDENGEAPLPDLMLEGYHEETFYLGSTNSIIYYGLPDASSYASLFEGEPVWSYELLSETDVDFYVNVSSYEEGSQWFDVYVEPDSPAGELNMKITLTWDTVSASVIANCTVVENPNGAPTGLAPIQSHYQIKLGESITLPYPTFLPEGWTAGPDAYVYVGCDNWDNPEFVHVTDLGDSFLVEFSNTGVYTMNLNRFEGGYSDFQQVYVVVTDEEGNCEVPELDAYVDLTTSHAVAGKGLWINLNVWGGTCSYPTLELTITQNGEVVKKFTNLEQTSWGKFLDVDLAAGRYDLELNVEDTMGNTIIISNPFTVIDPAPLAITNAKLVSYEDPNVPICFVEYTGGSDVAKIDLYVYNQLNSASPIRYVKYASASEYFHELPKGTYRVLVRISAGDEVVETYTNWFTVGAESTIMMDPGYYLIAPGTSYQLQLTGDLSTIASINWIVDNPSIGTITADGVYTSTAEGHNPVTALITLTNGANVAVGADVDNVNFDETLKLPAALTFIEDEAFYGTPALRVVIPSGVKSIGSQAFAECPNLMLLEIPATVENLAEDFLSGSPEVRIVCTEGSQAQVFAEANGIQYYLKK